MTKRIFAATLPDGQVVTRTTEREYTHAAIAWDQGNTYRRMVKRPGHVYTNRADGSSWDDGQPAEYEDHTIPARWVVLGFSGSRPLAEKASRMYPGNGWTKRQVVEVVEVVKPPKGAKTVQTDKNARWKDQAADQAARYNASQAAKVEQEVAAEPEAQTAQAEEATATPEALAVARAVRAPDAAFIEGIKAHPTDQLQIAADGFRAIENLPELEAARIRGVVEALDAEIASRQPDPQDVSPAVKVDGKYQRLEVPVAEGQFVNNLSCGKNDCHIWGPALVVYEVFPDGIDQHVQAR